MIFRFVKSLKFENFSFLFIPILFFVIQATSIFIQNSEPINEYNFYLFLIILIELAISKWIIIYNYITLFKIFALIYSKIYLYIIFDSLINITIIQILFFNSYNYYLPHQRFFPNTVLISLWSLLFLFYLHSHTLPIDFLSILSFSYSLTYLLIMHLKYLNDTKLFPFNNSEAD